MRLRIGLILAAVLATIFSPLATPAKAFGGYASAPTSVTDTAIAGGIRVNWSAPVDVDTGLTGYRVEYSTSGTAGTWNLAATVDSVTGTFDIVGLSQVATYVRVAATTAAGTGAYGYPWEIIYSTSALRRNSVGNVSYDSNYGLSSAGNQASNTFAAASFTRVKYRMETTISNVSKYVETDFYKWTFGGATGSTTATTEPTIAGIAVPSVNSGQQWSVQANVSDLQVFSDNTAVTKTIGASGRLEIWPWDYGVGTSGLATPGSATTYDYDDTPSGASSYASFQVHDLTNTKTVFAWNNTGYTNSYNAEVGYGNNSGANPDWTFCSKGSTFGTCPLPSSFKLLIYINPAVTPLLDAAPPTAIRVDSRSIGKNGDTITVRSNEIGTVYLVNQSVSVSTVDSITAAASNLKNSISISTANSNTTLTISNLTDGIYNLYAADSFNNLSSAVLGTIRVDNTAPTATSITVNSAGTAIIISASETITNSMQVYGWYAINDGTSSIAVTATTFSGTTATLTLARAIISGATVTFAYSPLSGSASGRWIDAAGNEMAAITSRTITNSSGVVIEVNLSAPTTVSKGSSLTLTAVVPVAGKVTFLIAGKRIPGCLNKAATGTPPISVTCTFRGALSGRQLLTSTLVPTLNVYPTTSTTVERFFLKRSTLR